METMAYGICVDCGAKYPASHPSCLHLFEKVIVTLSELPNHRSELRMAMDAYALQHSEQFCPHHRSIAVHLMGLCWGLEWKGDVKVARSMQKWLERREVIQQLPPPFISPFQEILTVADAWNVLGTERNEQFPQQVRIWAASVWAMWGEHHQKVREWIRSAVKEFPSEDQSA